MDRDTDLEIITEYEDAMKAISALRRDGRISARIYEILWNAIEDKRAVDEVYEQALKNKLPVKK